MACAHVTATYNQNFEGNFHFQTSGIADFSVLWLEDEIKIRFLNGTLAKFVEISTPTHSPRKHTRRGAPPSLGEGKPEKTGDRLGFYPSAPPVFPQDVF
jgi:hypothetical protein